MVVFLEKINNEVKAKHRSKISFKTTAFIVVGVFGFGFSSVSLIDLDALLLLFLLQFFLSDFLVYRYDFLVFVGLFLSLLLRWLLDDGFPIGSSFNA